MSLEKKNKNSIGGQKYKYLLYELSGVDKNLKIAYAF